MSYFREQLEHWLRQINIKTERVLDLGGASNPVRTRLGKFDVSEWIFFDNGIETPKVEYMQFDINKSLGQLEGYYREEVDEFNNKKTVVNGIFKFDAVFCLEVFEYVWDPVQAIKNIYELMNNDSVAYLSFPSIYPVHNPVEVDCLRYSKNAILKYLDMVGFTQIEITRRVATNGRNELAAFYRQEGMHLVRNSELPFDIGYLVKCRKLITS